jgi:hypothetical protein
MAFITITGLRLKTSIDAPLFWWHAMRSMMQAKAAPGNISADARTINGVDHTVSVWETKEAMRAYVVAGAHLKAMGVFNKIATGKVLSFEAETAPPWAEVHELWLREGRDI